MSAELKTALVNDMLDITQQFKQNCALRHGLPEKPVKQSVSGVTEEPKPDVGADLAAAILAKLPAATAATDSPSPGLGAAAVTGSRSLLSRAAPFILSAAGAGLPVGLGAWWLATREQPPIVQPSEQTADGSLLQWLQDKGQHLPEGSWPTK